MRRDENIKGLHKPAVLLTSPIIYLLAQLLASEHIYWDQASVLVQVGLIDPETLPVAGSESARKVVDPTSVPSNGLMERAKGGNSGDRLP
jgi:hypothetical protein